MSFNCRSLAYRTYCLLSLRDLAKFLPMSYTMSICIKSCEATMVLQELLHGTIQLLEPFRYILCWPADHFATELRQTFYRKQPSGHQNCQSLALFRVSSPDHHLKRFISGKDIFDKLSHHVGPSGKCQSQNGKVGHILEMKIYSLSFSCERDIMCAI